MEHCHHDSATKSRDEEDRNDDYELDSLCRSDCAYRENSKHGNVGDKGQTATETRQQKTDKTRKVTNAPTMMMNDMNDGRSFPGRYTKKICRENLNSNLLILVYEPFQL